MEYFLYKNFKQIKDKSRNLMRKLPMLNLIGNQMIIQKLHSQLKKYMNKELIFANKFLTGKMILTIQFINMYLWQRDHLKIQLMIFSNKNNHKQV
jgi:hypothetical protein